MNLDELERLHKEATPGEWRSFKRTTYFHLKTAGGGVYVAEPISGRMNFRHGHDTRYIAALHNAFPALLALARDGERYRWAQDNLFIGHVNDDVCTSMSSMDIDAARKGERP